MNKKRVKHNVIYVVIRLLLFFVRIVPRKIGLVASSLLGRFIFLFNTPEKKLTAKNLKIIFPNLTEKEIELRSKKIYINLTKNAYDAVYLSICSNKKFFDIVYYDDLSEFDKIYKEGRGLVGITYHLGCFELNVKLFAKLGYKVFSIGQKLYDSRVDKIASQLRTRGGAEYFHRDNSGREILKNLKRGKLFGVLADYKTGLDTMALDFLGHTAPCPTAPVRIAMKGKIPIIVAYSYRDYNDKHRFVIQDIFNPECDDNFDEALKKNMTKINDHISEGISNHPLQWTWMMKKWDVV